MTITMYGADWCGDCRRAKAWFGGNGIEFTYVDLEQTPDEVQTVLQRNDGLNRIPVIVFDDDTHLTEPTNDELAAKMHVLAGPAVAENRHLGRFELLRNGEVISFATYSEQAGAIVVPHVETRPEWRGNGHAAELMEGILAIIRADGRKITPLCPFAAAHIRDNQHHHDLLT